jgi:hypothetical protein
LITDGSRKALLLASLGNILRTLPHNKRTSQLVKKIFNTLASVDASSFAIAMDYIAVMCETQLSQNLVPFLSEFWMHNGIMTTSYYI